MASSSDALEPDLYRDALVYDVLHAPGSAEEARGLQRIARRFLEGRSDRWLEPACGTGRLLRAADRLGVRAAGFDTSERMVSFARQRSPSADVRVADMRSFMIARWRGAFDLAFNLMNTIRHLPSDRAMLDHAEQIAQALRPGGAYVVGLSLSNYGVEGPSEDVWTARRGSLGVTQNVQYEPPDRRLRRERVISHVVAERPGGSTHQDSAYDLRSYNLEQWTRLIERSSLTLEACIDERGNDVEPADGCYRLFVLRRG